MAARMWSKCPYKKIIKFIAFVIFIIQLRCYELNAKLKRQWTYFNTINFVIAVYVIVKREFRASHFRGCIVLWNLHYMILFPREVSG